MALWMSLARPAAAQTESVLVNFTGTSGAAPGAYPYFSNLIQASDGNFYGTTNLGGTIGATCTYGCGTVFKVSPAGTFTLVHSFLGAADGKTPSASLVQGTDGNLYGTTSYGGANNLGTVFKITSAGTFTLLHTFTSAITDGAIPDASLIQGTDGTFYGTTSIGGTYNNGSIYKITSTGTFTLLYSFSGPLDGEGLFYGLVQGTDGNFYGTTDSGGANLLGTAFKITPTGSFTLLHSFSNSADDGTNPLAGLVQGADGNFYGTSLYEAKALGAFFKISPSGTFTLLYAFTSATGTDPYGNLALGTDGNFYGAAEGGGTNSYGTVFDLSPVGTFTLLHNFTNSTTDGSRPQGGLAQGADGSFYGSTTSGGLTGLGTIFKLTPATPIPGPVQLTVPASVAPGAAFMLGYSTYNAYSATLQQCFATNTAGTTDWTGIYTSSPSTTTVNLTAPTTAGTYTYALTCGGMESGFATLNVVPATTYNPTTFSVSAVTAPFGSTAGVTVTATEAGSAGPVTGGVVTFSVLGPATGSFSPTTCTLTAAGTCTTTYIPTGTLAVNTYSNDIQASFAANNAYNPATANNNLIITAAASTPLTEPVNSTSAGQIATLTFTASGTLGTINVLTLGAPNLDFKQVLGGGGSGGPCIPGTAYTVGQSCVVFYNFTPSHPGMRYGGITLISTTGALLASNYISGIGTGPQVIWNPTTETTLGSGFNTPEGIAVDAAGDVFVADTFNMAVKEIQAGTGNVVTLATGFRDVGGGAIDGIGNLFVIDRVAGEIVELFASSGYTTKSNIINSFVYNPLAITVDRNGNVYIPDAQNNSILEFTASSGYTAFTTLGNPIPGYVDTLVVDGSGDLFFGTETGIQVQEMLAVNGSIPPSPTVITISNTVCGARNPNSLALDGDANLFVSCSGIVAAASPEQIQEILAVGGYTTVEDVGSNSYQVSGLVVDGSGNLYICNSLNNRILELNFATPPTLNFATTAVGQTSTDSPQAVTMSNDGNEPLIYSVPATGPNPTITPGFTVGSASTCPQLTSTSSAGMLAADASCTYSVSFTPITAGPASGFLVPTDNNLNIVNATQQVPLNGGGNPTVPTSTLLSITPQSGPTAGGTTVTITGTNFTNVTGVNFGTVAAASFAVNSVTQITAISPAEPAKVVDVTVITPSGPTTISPEDQFTFIAPTIGTQTINFPAPAGTAYAGTSVTLTAAASSGLPVSYSVVSGPAYATGSTLTYTAAGTVVVEADQAGSSSYGPAPPVQITIKPILLTEPDATASPVVPTVVIFSATGTLATINVLTQGAANLDFAPAAGSTCATGTTYAAGQTCTINFTFTPTRPGLRTGGISLTDSAGDLLASSYIYGEGVGPMVTYSPGVQSLVGSGLPGPSGVAVDGRGDIFVSNINGNGLYEILAGTGVVLQIGSFVAGDDVAVDGNGDVFIASNRTTVSEVIAHNGVIVTNSTVRTIASSFTALNGIKVDGNGDVFLASGTTGGTNNAVYEIPAVNGSIPANPTILTLGSGFGGPTGVAVDPSGDVFVADGVNNQIYEMLAVNGSIPAKPTVVTLGPGFSEPTNVAIDAAGNVFVPEFGNRDVKEMLAVNGSIAANPLVLTLGSGISSPQGLAIDSSGNVYVADESQASIVKLDFADPPTLSFANTYIGQTSTDSPQTVTTKNDGNAPLVYPVLSNGSNPAITPGFTIGSASTCPQALSLITPATLAVGASCTNLVSFTPVAAGLDSGFLTTTDNALGVVNAAQKVPLNGTGLVVVAPVITLTGTPNPVFLLNPVTFTATVYSPSYTPTGSVTFLDGTTPLGTVGLSGGVASLTTSTLAMGLHSITAVYTGPNLPPLTSAVFLELVEDFSLTITNPDVVIPHGGTGVFNLVVTTVGGTQIASTVGFGIAGSPDHSPVTFSPGTVAVGSGTTGVTLTIQTPDYPVGPWSSIVRPPVVLALTAFGALLLPFGRRRRRRLLLVAVLATFATLSGCGGVWKTQYYSMTVTASAGPLSHSVSAKLTSQQ
jgi:uncharacterized repeat protein (TIGR03803 family)